MTAGKLTLLPIHAVELDRTNPRIRRFLEIHDEPTVEHIALALDVTGGEDGQGATTPEKLRNSIRSNGGIMQPIIVNRHPDGRMVCIEGNTRLFIYRQFSQDQVPGEWSEIPALVHDSLHPYDIDAIRLQAHLVGPRQWDAYSKAKYLWELKNKEMMPIDRIVDFCGGNRRDVLQAIQAYSDMESYYRPICEPDEYDTEKYSGFVELQNQRRKDAILLAGFTLTNFAEWIKNGNIKGLIQIRQLPAVLADKRAREVFLKKDMKAALDVLEKPDLAIGLKGATIGQLARGLTEAIDRMEYAELKRLQATSDDDTVRYLGEALEALQGLIHDLTK
jgi:hypothetical protein